MMTKKRNERVEFNPQRYLMGYRLERYMHQPEPRGAIGQGPVMNG
jgi:hypothetical protein